MVPALLDGAGIGQGTRLLDVACGPGYVTGAAAERAGERVEGAVQNTDVDVDVTTGNEQNR